LEFVLERLLFHQDKILTKQTISFICKAQLFQYSSTIADDLEKTRTDLELIINATTNGLPVQEKSR
jgi:hypothetical protein